MKIRQPKSSFSLLPKGMSTLLPEAAARQRAVERLALGVFQRWGYQEIIPPLFEYLDVLSKGLDPRLIEKSYKFVDRSSGRMMILRPDVTPQVARIVALLMADRPKPIRLCYSANVFRYEEEHAGREREILQIGGELIGPRDAEADAEILAVVVELLRDLGLKQFRIALGSMGFLKSLFEALGLREADRFRIQRALEGRNASRLVRLLGELGKGRANLKKLAGLLELFGREEVFEKARRLVDQCLSDGGASRAALERLQTVYDLARRYGYADEFLIDLTEVRGFGYYSGVVFEVFAEGVGYELGGGGRYDHLIACFGPELPSIGFALHVDRLQQALDRQGALQRADGVRSGVDVFLLDARRDSADGIRLAQALRRKGFRVVRQATNGRELADHLRRSREPGAVHTVVLEPPPRSRVDEALWISWKKGLKKKVKIRELVRDLPVR